MQPLISVLIPSYNYERYILKAVDSVLRQTYRHVEVVVTDDGSTDGAPELVEARAAADRRVRLVRNERRLGIVGNFGRALAHARGDLVHWLPADDWMLPEHLERLAAAFERHPQIDVAYARVFFADEHDRIWSVKSQANMLLADYADLRDELPPALGGLPPLAISAALWRRALFTELGPLDEEVPILFDWELTARAAAAGKRFAFVSEPSVCVRLHPGSGSGAAFNASGQTVVQAVHIVEKHLRGSAPDRLEGRERSLAGRLDALYASDRERLQASGSQPGFGARFDALRAELLARAERYQPARVAESLISVIVPAIGPYQATLAAIDSVAAQSLGRWQLVLVDQSAFPLRQAVREHPCADRIAYVRVDRPVTPGVARNIGVDVARGTYLAFLDDDNRFGPDHLAGLAAAIFESGSEVAASSTRLAVEQSDELYEESAVVGTADHVFRGPGDPAELGLVANGLPLNAVLHHRRFFERAGGFNPRAVLLEDFDYLMRLQDGLAVGLTALPSLEVRVRLGLRLQALGMYTDSYLAALDALYAARPASGVVEALRVIHRRRVADALQHRGDADTAAGAARLVATLAGRGL